MVYLLKYNVRNLPLLKVLPSRKVLGVNTFRGILKQPAASVPYNFQDTSSATTITLTGLNKQHIQNYGYQVWYS